MPDRDVACPHQTSFRDLLDEDPYPAYQAADDQAAVLWDDSFGGWVVLRYAECAEVLRDSETFPMPWNMLDGGHLALGKYGVFNLTGSEHEQVHKLLLDFFNPRKNKDLKPMVQRLVGESLDRVIGQPHFDFAHDVAHRVPGMMAFAFLGIPGDESVLDVVHEANRALQAYMTGFGDDPAKIVELKAAHQSLEPYFGPTIRARKEQRANDLISLLWDMAETRPDWGHDEMLAQSLFYFGASFGNTANALINVVHELAVRPDLRERLAAQPDLVEAFVDEVTRVWASVQFRIRVAATDVIVGDQQVRAGDRLILIVGAANRDERQYERPTEIQLGRAGRRRYLTFGIGPRYCIGAALARLEAEEIVLELNRRFEDISTYPADAQLRFTGLNYRAFDPLVLAVTPRP